MSTGSDEHRVAMERDPEKHGAIEAERISKDSGDVEDFVVTEYSLLEQRRIIRKVDIRLVSVLAIMYISSVVDRTSVASAAIAGMKKDLSLVGDRYSIIVLVFFIPYVLFQPLANVVLRSFGPRNLLSAITIAWGATTIGFGFAQRWGGLVGLRVILGALEAGFFPATVYLLSTWYTRYELQTRNAVFYLIGCSLASAFSGILAYGLTQLNGLGGLEGWRWIFIMEGIITILLGVAGYFLIVDFPELASKSWRFLSEKEAAFMCARIQKDRADLEAPPFSFTAYVKCSMDLKIWGFACLLGLTTANIYAIAYFLPVILNRGMGFSVATSLCLVAPPNFAAGIYMLCFAWVGDKYRVRGVIIAGNAIIALIGLPLLGYAKNNGVRYFGVFLTTMAISANIPAILTYQANNIRGQWKRAFASATLVGAGGFGGIIGSTVFREADAPGYGPGILACMIANGLVLVITALLTLKFWIANKRADRDGKIIEGLEGFRYTL